MASRKRTRTTITDDILFLPPDTPKEVRVKAELWTEIFLHTIDTLLLATEGTHTTDSLIIKRASTIASSAVDEYECRWPGVLI